MWPNIPKVCVLGLRQTSRSVGVIRTAFNIMQFISGGVPVQDSQIIDTVTYRVCVQYTHTLKL